MVAHETGPTFPGAGLPGTDVGQLKRLAKEWLQKARAGDREAVALLRRLHPRGAELAEAPAALRLADAQLCVARYYHFTSWATLREHLGLVGRWRRNPHRVPAQRDPADELVRLACLTYGADDRTRPFRAAALLAADSELATANPYAAAVTGSVAALERFLDGSSSVVTAVGGPYRWTPLLYLCFSRLPDEPPARSSLACAELLLRAGADPNAGFLWEGLAPPFTCLTGAFGGGEDRANQPPHQHALTLARLLLDAGAEPNDGQTLYNKMFEPNDDHLELLFAYGLGRGTGGPWQERLGSALQSPAEMLADQLIWAVEAGRAERVAVLLTNGVDPNGVGSGHPTHEGRTAYEWAARTGSTEIAAMLEEAGARGLDQPLDPVDELIAAGLAGSAPTVWNSDPDLLERARARRPTAVTQAVELRRPDAVRLLVAAGFDVNGAGGTTPLHQAAYAGDLAMARLLVELGADLTREDPNHHSTPLGWAEHAHADEVATFLRGSLLR